MYMYVNIQGKRRGRGSKRERGKEQRRERGESVLYLVEEDAEVLVRRWINCCLEQGQKQVPQKLSKILQQFLLLVDITGTPRQEDHTRREGRKCFM